METNYSLSLSKLEVFTAKKKSASVRPQVHESIYSTKYVSTKDSSHINLR